MPMPSRDPHPAGYVLEELDLFLLGLVAEETRNVALWRNELPRGCSKDQVLNLERAGYLVLARPAAEDETISLQGCRITDAGRKAWEAYRIDI
jgi:hypothetical protein